MDPWGRHDVGSEKKAKTACNSPHFQANEVHYTVGADSADFVLNAAEVSPLMEQKAKMKGPGKATSEQREWV